MEPSETSGAIAQLDLCGGKEKPERGAQALLRKVVILGLPCHELVPLLINVLVFRKALVLASIGAPEIETQYYFLEAALAANVEY